MIGPRLFVLAAVGVLLTAHAPAAESAPANESAPEPERVQSFSLRDQFNDEHEVAFPRKQPTVLALADRRGSSQLEDWLEPLAEQYEERVHIEGVADVRGVPGPLRWGVRQIFRRGSPAPIMLDWDNTVCDAVAYERGQANLLVLDHEGRIVRREHGEATEESLANLGTALDGLLAATGSADDQQGQPGHEEEHHEDDLRHGEESVDLIVEGLASE